MTTYYVDPSVSPNAVWVTDTVYAVDDICVPVQDGGADNKYVYKVKSVAGDEKSGVAEPAWDATPGNDTVDDQVTWTCMAPDSWAEALRGIQGAFDLAAAGDTVYCRGTQTVSAKIDVDTNSGGNATGFIKFIGCNAAGNVDGTRFTIQGDGANACDLVYKTGAIHMVWLENIELKNAYGSSDGLSTDITATGSGWVFINCSFNNNTADGVSNARYLGSSIWFRCAFFSNGGHGFNSQGYTSHFFFFCSFHDNTGSGYICAADMCIALGCIFHGNGDDGTSIGAYYGTSFINSVFDSNTDDGVLMSASSSNFFNAILLGCRITNHSGGGDIGLNANTEPCITAYCYFEDNDGDNIQNATLHQFIPIVDGSTTSNVEDQADTTEGYTSTTSGSEDFNLRSDATLRRTAITIPWS